jgi:hypothetical protein|tara:strand:- start:119 stop:298 length:180 start_codon:yes stop_codon:yes gene_type:complete
MKKKLTQYDIESAKLLMDASMDARNNALNDLSYYEAHELYIKYRNKYRAKLSKFRKPLR